MQHFLAAAALVIEKGGGLVGQVQAEAMGFGLEVNQAWRAWYEDKPDLYHSAFLSEDLYSNSLGARFATEYDPTKSLPAQVEAFLLRHGAMSIEAFKLEFEAYYNSMPQTERDALNAYRNNP